MPRIEPESGKIKWYKSDGAKSVYASLISILIGLAVGINMRTEVNYVPVKTSWLANGIFSAGSVAIDADGIVELTTTEA